MTRIDAKPMSPTESELLGPHPYAEKVAERAFGRIRTLEAVVTLLTAGDSTRASEVIEKLELWCDSCVSRELEPACRGCEKCNGGVCPSDLPAGPVRTRHPDCGALCKPCHDEQADPCDELCRTCEERREAQPTTLELQQ